MLQSHGHEQSTVDIAASNSNTTWTGSRLPGGDAPPELTYSFGPGHYGMDSGNESNYLGKSNQQVQIPNPGVETHSVINPDGTVAPLYDEGQLQNGTDQLNDTLIEAPGYHWVGVNGVELGFNYAAFGAAIAPYNPLVAARQTMELGISGGAGMAAKVGTGMVGAVAGGVGGYQAAGWKGVLPGAGVGLVAGRAGAAVGDLFALKGLAGVAATSGIGGVSAAMSAMSVNALTGNPTLQGVPSSIVLGVISPLMSGEAMIVGGAGITTGAVSNGVNALSAAFTIGGTAAVGP